MSEPLVVLYGGGVNSVAMLVGMAARSIRPDAIVFSDTGSEHPATYAYNANVIARWLAENDLPELTVVKLRPGTGDKSLEDELLRRRSLPALAYGFKTCSQKWKRRPYEKWRKRVYGDAPVREAVGYDADEPHRHGNGGENTWAPLVEWGWGRAECKAQIVAAGLPLPRKSACFFCPAMRVAEVAALRDENPELFARACEIERLAQEAGSTSGSTKGLGRMFQWQRVADAPRQLEIDFPCECGR